jgi:hypothetical protein
MATLDKRTDRRSWLKWGIEFMRHGLWLDEEITVHGPHEPPADHMWGEATARIDGERDLRGVLCGFKTTRQVRSKYDVRHVRIFDAEDKEEAFPVLKISQLSPKARKWLKTARRTLREWN